MTFTETCGTDGAEVPEVPEGACGESGVLTPTDGVCGGSGTFTVTVGAGGGFGRLTWGAWGRFGPDVDEGEFPPGPSG